MRALPTAAAYNDKLRRFWAEQKRFLDERLADPTIRGLALARLQSEQQRDVPLRNQMTLKSALRESATAAEAIKNVARSDLARKGGRAKKQDEFQDWLDRLIAQNPRRITKPTLVEKARSERDGFGSIIVDVTDEKISFKTRNGKIKDVVLTSLQHRLSRAKKKLR